MDIQSIAPDPLRTLVRLAALASASFISLSHLGAETESTELGAIAIAVTESRANERLVNLDPRQSEWELEGFSERAERQLKYLGAWILGSDGELPATIFAEEKVWRVPLMKPAVEVFHDGTIRVRRGIAKDRSLSGESGEGREAHRIASDRARSELLASFGGDLESIDFKIFRVSPEGGDASISTMQQVTLVGEAQGGSREWNSIWRINWEIKEDPNRLPRIRTIDIDFLEEATAALRGGQEPILADCTESVFGTLESYQRQLKYGTGHWLAQLENRFSVFYFGHHGIALGDVDGDGLDDLYLCQPGGLPNRLYLHNPDGSVSDGSAEAAVDLLDYTGSSLLVDLDNDGDQDLVAGTLDQLLLFSNDGKGRFDLEVGDPRAARALSLSAADYDRDGDLDLYLCRYFADRSQEGRYALPSPYYDAENGGSNILLRNDGNWVFSDATAETGLSENNSRFSFAAAWEDFDNDGDLDLYVANDFGRNNLYRNDRGRFMDVARAAGVEDISAGMSVTWADYDRDGWMDLYVSNMFSNAGNRIAYQREFQEELGEDARTLYRRHARGNSLFENRGDGRFTDVSISSGTTMGRWAWASLFVDLNRDGWEDLLVCNGYITGERLDDL